MWCCLTNCHLSKFSKECKVILPNAACQGYIWNFWLVWMHSFNQIMYIDSFLVPENCCLLGLVARRGIVRALDLEGGGVQYNILPIYLQLKYIRDRRLIEVSKETQWNTGAMETTTKIWKFCWKFYLLAGITALTIFDIGTLEKF